MSIQEFGSFAMDVDMNNVARIIFSRPPVNAVSLSVYEDLGRLCDAIERDTTIRVAVLTAPLEARAWCGGADLNDFIGMTSDQRKDRYNFINTRVPRLGNLERPLIAAINGPTIGIGVILAALCDLRVTAEDAIFSCPEIDYGLVGGGSGLLAQLNVPQAKIREMYLTGARFSGRELEPTGFFNYVLPRDEVEDKAMALANSIAAKSMPAIRARKLASVVEAGRGWIDAYLDCQSLSAELVSGSDSDEGARAFLEGRVPQYNK
jgi:enoyl-CoA hydratase/carnithine racemase|tara:strand:- start:18034 stop:18822 length:789 start_codon:yes stop_codon:yes gene_type:complete